MFTINVPRPDVSTEEVTKALNDALGHRYKVLPGMKASRIPFRKPEPDQPDSIAVGNRAWWTQVTVIRGVGQTQIKVDSAGRISLGGWIINVLGIDRKVRQVLQDAPGLGSTG